MNIKFFLCLSIFVLCSIVCRADETTETNASAQSAAASQELQGFNLNGYNNNGEKTWDINGTKAGKDIKGEGYMELTGYDKPFSLPKP